MTPEQERAEARDPIKLAALSRHELIKLIRNSLDREEQLQAQVEQLIAENERIKVTLEWYADHTNYDPYRFMRDDGKRAREALNQS